MNTIIEQKQNPLVLYEPGKGYIEAVMHSCGTQSNYGTPLAEMMADTPNALIMPLSQACEAIDKADSERFGTPPIEIDAETYRDALNVLPPCRWQGDVFYISEATKGFYHAMYCRIGERYYTATRNVKETTNREFRSQCAELI